MTSLFFFFLSRNREAREAQLRTASLSRIWNYPVISSLESITLVAIGRVCHSLEPFRLLGQQRCV